MKHLISLSLLTTLCLTAAPSFSKESARGLYVEQLSKPTAKINSGVQYWMELQRNGRKSKVSNRTAFYDGDKLRIHVKPNFNGFAYVLMLQGSNGEKSVLFPAAGLGGNRLVAGRELVLPVAKPGKDAWIKFDENPGTEVVRVLLSRAKINPDNELDKASIVIAGADSSDDNIPDDTSVCVVASRKMKIRAGTRNLVVETDEAPQEQGHTYVVSKSGKPLSIDIALDHKSHD